MWSVTNIVLTILHMIKSQLVPIRDKTCTCEECQFQSLSWIWHHGSHKSELFLKFKNWLLFTCTIVFPSAVASLQRTLIFLKSFRINNGCFQFSVVGRWHDVVWFLKVPIKAFSFCFIWTLERTTIGCHSNSLAPELSCNRRDWDWFVSSSWLVIRWKNWYGPVGYIRSDLLQGFVERYHSAVLHPHGEQRFTTPVTGQTWTLKMKWIEDKVKVAQRFICFEKLLNHTTGK